MICATIIADSIAPHGKRITTFELILPKTFQAQLNTHRKISKNASSARAIPVRKFMESVLHTPVIPIWTLNQPGMVGERLDNQDLADQATKLWLEARDKMVASAEALMALGIHKQSANRLLEPFFYTKVVATSTEFEWLYHLRDHGDAQGEMELLAQKMRNAAAASTPVEMCYGEYHLPYVLEEEQTLPLHVQLKISVARCARTSYRTFDDHRPSTIEKDERLFDDLLVSGHLSPFEHQATPARYETIKSANFDGWLQYRQDVGSGIYYEITGLS